MKYQWAAPLYFEGQIVRFLSHERLGVRRVLIGKIVHIETTYDVEYIAFHSYGLRVNGYQRIRWMAERDIVELLGEMPR